MIDIMERANDMQKKMKSHFKSHQEKIWAKAKKGIRKMK